MLYQPLRTPQQPPWIALAITIHNSAPPKFLLLCFIPNVDLTVEKQLQWEVKIIPFNGVPFKIIGKKTYVCHQGRDKHAKAKQRRQESKVRASRTNV